jgi:hypothetical protein
VAQPKIDVDVTYFPVVLQSTHPGYKRDDTIAMLDAFEALLERGDRYALVAHYRLDAGMMKASDRKLVTDWWSSRKQRIQELNVLTVTVLPSTILRGGMTAILWVVQPSIRIVSAASVEEGIRIAAEGLRAAGVPLSAPLQRRLA